MSRATVTYLNHDGRRVDWDASRDRLIQMVDEAVAESGNDPSLVELHVKMKLNPFVGSTARNEPTIRANDVAYRVWSDENWLVFVDEQTDVEE